ncbi:guanine(37)-N1-methyltransferase [Halteromyces radiatus]|uniref:guanine(37)-N1-methyltransferase n=1 Tax=Halteromyces radiatus TaxID=101107 RepID=UPI0022204928|nr:guanine(37)-N1-methyltransferase [Halteromyces radiatus]KAI8083103.1 guanine(37)-N1-methyltransferase [Halteromyces radiatus]
MLAPPAHHGMTVLNREAFKTSIKTLALRVPLKKIKLVQKTLSNDILGLPRLPSVVRDPEFNETRLLLLRDDLKDVNELPSESKKFIDNEELKVVTHNIDLDYSYWTTEQILHSVIPDTVKEIPSAYTQVGHIAHMNLREELYPWKHLIGQVFLDKNKNITSVVNKINSIDTTFRFFKMEVLAGDSNMIAEVKESGCRFKFDFSKVYWNSRLHTEHDRLVKSFKKDELVCDVFAGVGPFAVPAAKNGVTVYANDLNPESFRWLKENKTHNKIPESRLKTYNMDGRDFIRQAVKDLAKVNEGKWKTFDHFVMNLPETAIDFLDAFRGLYQDQKALYDSLDPSPKLPTVHCHCFTRSDDPAQDIAKRVEQVIVSPYDASKSNLHWVRNVAPKKDMYCISFPLTAEMIFTKSNGKRKQDQVDAFVSPEPSKKKSTN